MSCAPSLDPHTHTVKMSTISAPIAAPALAARARVAGASRVRSAAVVRPAARNLVVMAATGECFGFPWASGGDGEGRLAPRCHRISGMNVATP